MQAKDSGELGESLTNLILKVKDVNVSEVMGSPGFLQSLPLVGSLFSSAKRTVAKSTPFRNRSKSSSTSWTRP